MTDIAENYQKFVGQNVRDPRDFLNIMSYTRMNKLNIEYHLSGVGIQDSITNPATKVNMVLDDKWYITKIWLS